MDFYLAWFDDDRKKETGLKIQEAVAAYERRFRRHPNIVLINEQDRTEGVADVQLRPISYIRPSTFYVGFEEAA
ncbi:MAG TPA: hypothetical protein VFZ66_21575 [Herpetosiphonaceae bacterium]